MNLGDESSGAADIANQLVRMNSDGIPSKENGSSVSNTGGLRSGDDEEDGLSRCRVDDEAVSGSMAVSGWETKRSDGISVSEAEPFMEKKEELASENGGVNESSKEGRLDKDDGARDSFTASISSPVDKQALAGTPSPDGLGITTKGNGLRKWRRRRRDIAKDGGAAHDLHRELKRGLSNVHPQSGSSQVGFGDNRQGSVASVDSAIGLEFLPLLISATPLQNSSAGSFSDARFVGAYSENSEDQSSRSSTVASVPRMKDDVAVGSGHKGEQVRGKNLVQVPGIHSKPKDFDDGSKKFRVEIINDSHGEFNDETLAHLEGEGSSKVDEQVNDQGDSYSSMESDSRSSARVGSFDSGTLISKNGDLTGASRWTQKQKNYLSSDYDGDVNQFEYRTGEVALEEEKHESNDILANYYQENGGDLRREESSDTLHSSCQTVSKDHNFFLHMASKRGEMVGPVKLMNQNHGSPTEMDHWTKSLGQLEAVQQALEKEIQNVKIIRREAWLPGISSLSLESVDKHGGILPATSAAGGKLHLGEIEENSLLSVQDLPSVLHCKVMHLENKLKDSDSRIKHKVGRLQELEAVIAGTNLLKDVSELRKKIDEMETEIEILLKEKVEAEVKYAVVNGTAKKLKYFLEDELLVESHESLLADWSQVSVKLKDAETHVFLLRSQAEELGSARDILCGRENILKMQTTVHRIGFVCFIQLILLCIAVRFFILQQPPHSMGIVPT